MFFQDYTDLGNIGEGSFASVHKIRHAQLGYVRALKICKEFIEDENDPKYASFLNECKVLLQIGNGCHPNIIRIYQPRLIDHRAVVEMDFIDGITLVDYLKEHKCLAYDEFERLARQITSALAYCHTDLYRFLMNPDDDDLDADPEDGSRYLISPEKEEQLREKYSVCHNDLHSNNIMRRNYDGNYVLLDFGLAIQDNHCVKSSSRRNGASEYCSPEKLEGKDITMASDVYSLGILLYEALAGKVPFVNQSNNENDIAALATLLDEHLHRQPDPIEPLRRAAFEEANPGQTYRRDYPERLDEIIMKCLAKDPADRYANARLLMEDLNRAFSEYDRCRIIEGDPADGHPAPADEETRVLRNRIEMLSGQLEESRRRLSEAESSKAEVVEQNKQLIKQLRQVQAAPTHEYAAEEEYSEANRPKRSAAVVAFWLLSFIAMAASAAFTYYCYEKTSYFGSRGKEFDLLTLGACFVGVLSVGLIGLSRRVHTAVWSLVGILIAAVGALQYFSSFKSNVEICCATGVALFLYMTAWLCYEFKRTD